MKRWAVHPGIESCSSWRATCSARSNPDFLDRDFMGGIPNRPRLRVGSLRSQLPFEPVCLRLLTLRRLSRAIRMVTGILLIFATWASCVALHKG